MTKEVLFHRQFSKDIKNLEKNHKNDKIDLALDLLSRLAAGKDIPPGKRRGPLRGNLAYLLHARINGDLRLMYHVGDSVHAVALCGHKEMKQRKFDPADLGTDWDTDK